MVNCGTAHRKRASYSVNCHFPRVVGFQANYAWIMADAVMGQDFLFVTARHKLHTAVFESRGLKWNPDAKIVIIESRVPISLILMPRLLPRLPTSSR